MQVAGILASIGVVALFAWRLARWNQRLARARSRTRPTPPAQAPQRGLPAAEDAVYAEVTTRLHRLRRDFLAGRITAVDHDRQAKLLLDRLEPDSSAPPAPDARRHPVSRETVDRVVACAELVITTQFGSTSMLQRKLNLTPGDAAAAMTILEERGIVGPGGGTRARDVLVPPDGLLTVVVGLWRETIPHTG